MTHTRPVSSTVSSRPVGRPTLLVFADDWGRHPSSCQHLVRRLCQQYPTVWVNTIGTRGLRFDLFTVRRVFEKLRNWRKGLDTSPDGPSVVDVPMFPSVGTSFSRRVNRLLVTWNLRRRLRRLDFHRPIVLTTLPHAVWLLGDIGQVATVYYCTDDYSEWPSADRTAFLAAERELLSKADLALAVSQRLMDRCSSAKRCEYLPHAVDAGHFAKSAEVEPCKQLKDLPGPRIGFFGLIYEKLDFDLLTKVARAFPQASLVLLGPVDHCPSAFAELSNVYLLGAQPYDELPKWLAGMDVLLMPYVIDEMIRQSNPLKLRECLATGIPTVSVDVPAAREYEPLVRIGSTHEQFVQHVGELLSEERNGSMADARRRAVAAETWDVRALQLREYIEQLAGESKPECPAQ